MVNFVRSKLDLFMIIYGSVEVFFFGGITYGWPNLVRALKEERYFYEYCDGPLNETLSNGTATENCPEQDNMFGIVYNIASTTTGVGNLLIGTAIDRIPMFAARLLSICLFLIGSLCITFSTPASAKLLIPGMLFVRISGFIFYYGNMRLANAAPKIKGSIITLYAGLYDSSSAVLYFIMLAYQSGVTVQRAFMIIAISLIAPLVTTLLLFPVNSISQSETFERFPQVVHKYFNKKKKINQSQVDIVHCDNNESLKIDDTKAETDQVQQNDDLKISKFKNWLHQKDMSFLLDEKFYWFLVLMSVLGLRNEFYILSYDASLVKSAEGDKDLINHYTAVFGISQLFAILITTLGGFAIDYSRLRGFLMAYVPQFGLTILCGTLLCVCSFIEHIEILYLSNILYVIFRALTFSISAAYVADMYPMKMFGSILGTTISVSFLLSLSQYPLFAWTNGPLEQDYKPVNGIILAFCLIGAVHPIRLFFYYRKKPKEVEAQPDKDTKETSLKT